MDRVRVDDARRESEPAPRYVCVVSDATGSTARRVVEATLVQFRDVPVAVEVAAPVRTRDEVRAVVERTRDRRGLIAYTLVDRALRQEIVARANEAGVDTVDIIGPLMTALARFLTATPSWMPGLLKPGDADYARLDAVNFTVRHDDGRGLHDLKLADVVIVGPSRTSKTPLSVYLAHTRGLKVANVPLAVGIPLFEALDLLEEGRVVALTMRADLLAEMRRRRVEEMGNPPIEYAQLPFVERELRYCHEVYCVRPWAVVDVTSRSLEEVASEVCTLTVDRPGRAAAAG